MKRTALAAVLLALLVSPGRPAAQEAAAPPAGKYVCYYYGDYYALTSSSLGEIRVLPRSRMEIVGETVPYGLKGSALTLRGGKFEGATGHYKLDSDKKPAIVFIRKENEEKGHKIDISDTWCYLEKEK